MKKHYRIKNLPDPISIREACSKNYVDNLFNDPSILKNTAHIDFNDRNITNAKFIQVTQWPQNDCHLTAKLYVNNSIDESSLVRLNKDNDFGNYNLTKNNCITLNKQAENDNEVITKAYVDQFHRENERSRRDIGLDFYDESNDLVKKNQDNDFNDNKLTNINSIQVNREPIANKDLSTKKYSDDSMGEGTIVRYSQSLEKYLKLSVLNDTYNLTKYNKIQISDTTIIQGPNVGGNLLQKWFIECNDINNNGKIQKIFRSTKTMSPKGYLGASILPPIGLAFMYIATSSDNHGNNVCCSFERSDIIQITNITFYYNRFSILTNDSLNSMGRFRIKVLLENNTWSTRYNIAKNDQFCDTSTEWTLVSLNFTIENYGIEIIYDQIGTANADMCFSNIMITHSVY